MDTKKSLLRKVIKCYERYLEYLKEEDSNNEAPIIVGTVFWLRDAIVWSATELEEKLDSIDFATEKNPFVKWQISWWATVYRVMTDDAEHIEELQTMISIVNKIID